jgi:hypothetical protein
MKKLINKIIGFFKKKEVVVEVKSKAKSSKPKTTKK